MGKEKGKKKNLKKSKRVVKSRQKRTGLKAKSALPPLERRKSVRYKVKMQVDYKCGENFLFSYIDNISELGIFISTKKPLKAGSRLLLRFSPPTGEEPFEVKGEVVWVNPYRKNGENINPGMGIKFVGLTELQKRKIKELITTIAYLYENWV